MLRDPVSNPIRWLMMVSAICLTIFLYTFTNKTIAYVDYVDQQSEQIDKEGTNILKKHRALKKDSNADIIQDVQPLDQPSRLLNNYIWQLHQANFGCKMRITPQGSYGYLSSRFAFFA